MLLSSPSGVVGGRFRPGWARRRTTAPGSVCRRQHARGAGTATARSPSPPAFAAPLQGLTPPNVIPFVEAAHLALCSTLLTQLPNPQGLTLPDVILVRKSYEDKRRRRRQRGAAARPWRLKRMAVDAGEEEGGAPEARGGGRGRGLTPAEQEQADMERFLQARAAARRAGSPWRRRAGRRAPHAHKLTASLPTLHPRLQELEEDPDMRAEPPTSTLRSLRALNPLLVPPQCLPQELEEDPDMRARVALYKDPAFDPAAAAAAAAAQAGMGETGAPLRGAKLVGGLGLGAGGAPRSAAARSWLAVWGWGRAARRSAAALAGQTSARRCGPTRRHPPVACRPHPCACSAPLPSAADDEEGGEVPQVPLEELLDDLAALELGEGAWEGPEQECALCFLVSRCPRCALPCWTTRRRWRWARVRSWPPAACLPLGCGALMAAVAPAAWMAWHAAARLRCPDALSLLRTLASCRCSLWAHRRRRRRCPAASSVQATRTAAATAAAT